MRFKFELDSNETDGTDRLVACDDKRPPLVRPVPFTWVMAIGAPIIYTPTVADPNGDSGTQTTADSYTIQRHKCFFNNTNYIIPVVSLNTSPDVYEVPLNTPTQVQFFTQGLFANSEPGNMWYQTMSVMPTSSPFLPFRHRVIDLYNPATASALPGVTQAVGSEVTLAQVNNPADIIVAIPNVGSFLFSWQLIDGIENLFLQQHA
jgi:hypothetical protein